jgi:hypothetical protein
VIKMKIGIAKRYRKHIIIELLFSNPLFYELFIDIEFIA